ncbi:hypothetical protein F4680DRAFT_444115 [Xylaria scruposa]|nr:hypothetical protein F4680DRAFT_444115 [Xylaria scruposa]
MSSPFYLHALVGAVLIAWVISTTGSVFVVFLVTFTGLILVNLQAQSPPTTKLSTSQGPPVKDRLLAKNKPARRYQTYCISNIPISVTQDALCEALAETGTEGNLIGFSYALAVASTLSSKYRVATVTFIEAPEITELQKALRIRFGSQASLLRVDSDFFGLTPLNALSHIKVDIIAVVGLAGHGFGTWKAKGRPDMWLRDFLPEVVPDARIMTYGYDTELPGSQSEKSVVDLSRNLLESIKTSRDETCRHRPLILVGHSLGGLVLKHALVQASEGSVEDKAIFTSCFALLLFGVPNRGMDNESLMAMVRGQPNEAIVRELSPSSRFLSELHRQFNKIFTLDGSTIISWYETKGTATIEYSEETGSFQKTNKFRILVEHTSATHAGPDEKNYDQLSIDADHSDIVKFDNPSNPYYVVVVERLRKLVTLGPEVLAERLAERQRRLSEREKNYIRLLNAPDYIAFRKYKIAEPAPNTLGWFLDNPDFMTWKYGEQPSLLWIKGSAGQGKTILAKFLLGHLESIIAEAKAKDTIVIYFFFYEQDVALRTIEAALRALIRQLLSARDLETFAAISERVQLDGSQIDEVGLWDVLERLLTAPMLKKVFCVIDALDEVPDTKLRKEFITLFRRLTAPSGADPLVPVLKTLIVSRPTIDIDRLLNKSPTINLVANPHDLQAFILQELAFLRDQWDGKQHTTAINMLISRTEQTFLWISLVARRLKAAAVLTMAEIKTIISESPSDLNKFYDSIVTDVMGRDGDIPKKLLLWAVYWRRPLTLAELEEAISVQHDSKSIASTSEYRLHLDKNKNSLVGAIGVIVNISDDSKVHLIHQSVKDFLVNSSHLAGAEFCRGLRPNLYLAKVCMLFLCFPDSDADPINDGRMGFLRYASWNWHHHIESDLDAANSLSDLIKRVTEPKSSVLLRWARVAGISSGLENAEGGWDIAMRANINWLGEFKTEESAFYVDVQHVTDAANRGEPGYAPFLAFVQRTDIIFTDEAVYAMVGRFDQPMVRAYCESHWDIPQGQAIYDAALHNIAGQTFPMFRYLFQLSKDQRLPRLIVHEQFAQSLITYSSKLPPSEGLPNFDDDEEEDKQRSGNMSRVLHFLLRSASVGFTPTGWVELLLWGTAFDPSIVLYALESREDCDWTDVLLELVNRTIDISYYTEGHSMLSMFSPKVDWIVRYPNLEKGRISRLLSECRDLRGVKDDRVACWAARWLRVDDFKILMTKSPSSWFQIDDLLVNAALAGNVELVLFLVETRGDEIRENEECVSHVICGPAAREFAGKENEGDYKWTRWEQEAAEHRWGQYYYGEHCIWNLLLAGIGSKIAVSDRVLEGARRRQYTGVANALSRMQADGTEFGAQNLADLLEPPLAGWKRTSLQSASAVASFQKCGRDVRLSQDFGVRAALYKEVVMLALVLENWPEAVYITTEFLKAAVATVDFAELNRRSSFFPEEIPAMENDHYTRDYDIEQEGSALELLKLLLKHRRRDVELAIHDDVCHTAAACGSQSVLKLLCEEYLIPLKNEWSVITKVRRTVRYQPADITEVLENCALLDTTDYWGVSPVMSAIHRLNIHMVRFLLESGAVDINKADTQGRTPLYWACSGYFKGNHTAERLSIVVMLLRAGAQLDVVDNHGNTPLDWARKNKFLEMEVVLEDVKEAQNRSLDLEMLFDLVLERLKNYDASKYSQQSWDSMLGRPPPTPDMPHEESKDCDDEGEPGVQRTISDLSLSVTSDDLSLSMF